MLYWSQTCLGHVLEFGIWHQYITIGSLNCIPIVDYRSVKFQTKLPAGILTVVLHNVIYVPSLKVNLVSLGALYREDVSI